EAVSRARVEQREDVWMLQACGGGDLLHKPLGPEDRRELGLQHLDRHVALVLEILGEEHRGHPAGPKLAFDAVAAGESGVELVDRTHRGFPTNTRDIPPPPSSRSSVLPLRVAWSRSRRFEDGSWCSGETA